MNLRSAGRTQVRTAWQAVPTVIGVILLNFVPVSYTHLTLPTKA